MDKDLIVLISHFLNAFQNIFDLYTHSIQSSLKFGNCIFPIVRCFFYCLSGLFHFSY